MRLNLTAMNGAAIVIAMMLTTACKAAINGSPYQLVCIDKNGSESYRSATNPRSHIYQPTDQDSWKVGSWIYNQEPGETCRPEPSK